VRDCATLDAVPAQNLAVKAVVTPVLIGGASLADRRFGHHVGGWLVGLPLTSGPVAFFLATDQGVSFAGGAAVGMMAGTISQVVFALGYRAVARRGALRAFLAGTLGFAVSTVTLSFVHWSALATFGLVFAALVVGYAAGTRGPDEPPSDPVPSPHWDIPVRMLAATSVVLLITGSAPVLGAHLAGLLSPFPVFGAVLAIFTHHTHRGRGASQVLAGLLLGLSAPAVFFLVLAVMLPSVGFAAFALATAAALAAQGLTIFAIPREQPAGP
jgi:hypothetical protein